MHHASILHHNVCNALILPIVQFVHLATLDYSVIHVMLDIQELIVILALLDTIKLAMDTAYLVLMSAHSVINAQLFQLARYAELAMQFQPAHFALQGTMHQLHYLPSYVLHVRQLLMHNVFNAQVQLLASSVLSDMQAVYAIIVILVMLEQAVLSAILDIIQIMEFVHLVL